MPFALGSPRNGYEAPQIQGFSGIIMARYQNNDGTVGWSVISVTTTQIRPIFLWIVQSGATITNCSPDDVCISSASISEQYVARRAGFD
jgi:hypothetical protein